MNFFNLYLLGRPSQEIVVLEEEPKTLGLAGHRAAVGKSIVDVWPTDAAMQPPEENPGVKLTSLISNTFSYLIADSALKNAILQHCADLPMEVLPFTLLDHRGRVRSKDYVVLNPLGDRDVVDKTASEIDYSGDQVAGIVKLVLDPEKLEAAPALFRLTQKRQLLIVNQSLADAIRGFSNIVLRRIPVSAKKA
jgi:hypothetical protein